MMVLTALVVLTGMAYAGLIAWLSLGWLRPAPAVRASAPITGFSVVLPARNEEGNIERVLDCLRRQDYPPEQFEVIVVNDHSADKTASRAAAFIRKHRLGHFRLLDASFPGSSPGKKKALALAIGEANGDYVVTTDADCSMGSGWLRTIATELAAHRAHMLAGPVGIGPERDVFERLQALELLSLTGAGAAAAAQGRPILCSGANLAFSRELFHNVCGYTGNEHLASGDDVFLMHKFKARPGVAVAFAKDPAALVRTLPVGKLRQFFVQRRRWVAKTGHYRDGFTKLAALVVAAFNASLIVALIGGAVAGGGWFAVAGACWLAKGLVDLPLLMMVARQYRQLPLLWVYPLAWIMYPFYALAVSVSGLAGQGGWK